MKSIQFSVTASLDGEDTEDNPYLIQDNADWIQLATKVAEGISFSGQYVKLTADSISATTLVGIDENHPFSGTFDGGGKTLFATISDTEGAGTALFRNISDAWYTISGMKLGTQPRQKGVYIYKGNKVVIK